MSVVGRPTIYSKKMTARILQLLSMGFSLRKICSYPDMPAMPTIMRWLNEDDKKEFREQYAQARAMRTEKLEDEVIDIADNVAREVPLMVKGMPLVDDDGKPIMVTMIDNAAVQHARLMIDTRHRHLEAMKPKQYGRMAGLGEEIKTGLLAKMEAARGRLKSLDEKRGRTFDNETGDPVDK